MEHSGKQWAGRDAAAGGNARALHPGRLTLTTFGSPSVGEIFPTGGRMERSDHEAIACQGFPLQRPHIARPEQCPAPVSRWEVCRFTALYLYRSITGKRLKRLSIRSDRLEEAGSKPPVAARDCGAIACCLRLFCRDDFDRANHLTAFKRTLKY
ncbi:MAG: hypothetical protein LBQ54_08720 [Planctomycetaceae bacterium]|nr:hypothetical protein [Planctomycetaceae bacterium]